MYALILILLFPFTHSSNQCKSLDAKLKEMRRVQYELSSRGIRGPARDFINAELDQGIPMPAMALQRLTPNVPIKDIHFGGADKFTEHFVKHKNEFPGLNQKGYLRRAQELAESVNEGLITFKTPYSLMKYNPATNELLVLANNRVKTFFKPNLNFINDIANRPRKEEFKSVFDWIVSEKVLDH